MQGLQDKNVLITGGASGIGAATVERFLQEGANVVILDCNADGCQTIKKTLPEITDTLVADVSDFKSVNQAFTQLDKIFSRLDVTINNAGISIRHRFLEISQQEWQQVMGVNINGVFYVAQQSSLRMLKHGGVILNMGSTNALTGYPFYADYNVSKAGVVELTRSMALELAPKIRVNAVCPGYIMTPMQEAEYTPEMIEAVNSKIPLRRHGKPEEAAALFAFLASDEAAFITGQYYVLDGGETAGGLASR